MKRILLTLLIFISLIAISSALVEFGVVCEDENIVYKMDKLDNAHVALWNISKDGYLNVCYGEDSGHECVDFNDDGINDNIIFRVGLNRDVNAHVEESGLNTSGYKDLCFGGVECNYKNECDQDEECFGSIFRSKNSHVGDCDAYYTKICCIPGCRIEELFWSKNGVNRISSVNEDDIVFMVVKGSNACKDIDVNLKVKQIASVGSILSINTSFNDDSNVEMSWRARRHCDKHALFCSIDPSFYFEVKLFGNTKKSDDLVVKQKGSVVSECGDGRITGREICDINSKLDNSDDIFVQNMKCGDVGWNGSLTCHGCYKINTSSCQGPSGRCGDNKLNQGEMCDGDTFFRNFDSCNELKSDLNGELTCQRCQYSSDSCNLPDTGGVRCGSCDKCDNLFSASCTQSVCINACGGPGSCYYDPGIGEDCKSCRLVTSCEDYTNELDCEIDRCLIILDNPCEWIEQGCRENKKCTWQCENVYSECINGVRSKVGTCRLLSGDCNVLLDNPAINYPEEITCFEAEEDFPAFTWLNVIIGATLIVCYYIIRKRIK